MKGRISAVAVFAMLLASCGSESETEKGIAIQTQSAQSEPAEKAETKSAENSSHLVSYIFNLIESRAYFKSADISTFSDSGQGEEHSFPIQYFSPDYGQEKDQPISKFSGTTTCQFGGEMTVSVKDENRDGTLNSGDHRITEYRECSTLDGTINGELDVLIQSEGEGVFEYEMLFRGISIKSQGVTSQINGLLGARGNSELPEEHKSKVSLAGLTGEIRVIQNYPRAQVNYTQRLENGKIEREKDSITLDTPFFYQGNVALRPSQQIELQVEFDTPLSYEGASLKSADLLFKLKEKSYRILRKSETEVLVNADINNDGKTDHQKLVTLEKLRAGDFYIP